MVSERQVTNRQTALLFWGILLLMLAGFAAWQWRGIQALPWKYDEGLNVVKAQLLADGHALYREVWSDQPPAFTIALLVFFRVLGAQVWVGRLLVLLTAMLGAAALGFIGRLWRGAIAGIVAAGVFLLLPHTQELARLIMIGLPAIAVAVAALAALVAYREHGHPWLAALAGALLATSLLIKAITLPLVPVALILLFVDPDSGAGATARARTKQSLLAWLLGGLVPLLLVLLVAQPGAMLSQVVGTLGGARSFHGLDLATNGAMLAEYLFADKWGLSFLGLMLMAAIGLGALWRGHQRTEAAAVIVWLIVCVAALLWQTPLRRHHLILLMPALALGAGVGVSAVWASLGQPKRSVWRWLLALTCVGLFGYDMGRCVVADVADRQAVAMLDTETLVGLDAVAYLVAATPPGALVVTDDPMLAFLAGRPVPAALAVPSARRVEAGEINDHMLVDLCIAQQPAAILLWEQRLARLDGFVQWARQNYTGVRAYQDARWIMMAPGLLVGPGTFAQDARAENGIVLSGLNLAQMAVDPGKALTLDVLLQAGAVQMADCTLFVHLLEPDGTRIAGHDLVPLDDHYPASQWVAGERLAQRISIDVPVDAQPGAKLLAFGLYTADGRVALADGEGYALPGSQVISTAKPVVRWPTQTSPPARAHGLDATLGDGVRLVGYSAARTSGQLAVDLSWQALAPMWQNYTVFVHVYQQGRLIGQQDQQPGQGRYPTTGWAPLEYINDHYEIALDQDASTVEALSLAVGMYRLDTGERLPVMLDGVLQPNGQLELTLE